MMSCLPSVDNSVFLAWNAYHSVLLCCLFGLSLIKSFEIYFKNIVILGKLLKVRLMVI